MRNLHIDYQGDALNYQSASLLAKGIARENQMQDPTIMAWHSRDGMSPRYEGGNPASWWEKYGEGNGGRLEVRIGDDFQFVLMDTRGYETLDDIPLRNLTDSQGNQYLCYTPMQGKASNTPNPEACTLLDGWLADQY